MNSATLLEGIRDANYHKSGIKCLQVFRVDETYLSQLQADVERLCRSERGSRVGEADHITNWTRPVGEVVQFSLLNASGRYDDFRTDHDLSCFGKRFHGGSKYPVLAPLTDLFPHTVNFRINLMGPGAGLYPHEEHTVIRTRAGSVALRTRFHLPVFTNPDAEMVLDGEVYQLKVGIVYFVNHGCVHSARNGGDKNRVHLVWDMLLTYEAFGFMFEQCEPMHPLIRINEIEWFPTPVRQERVGAYERIAPLVNEHEANLIEWCEVQ